MRFSNIFKGLAVVFLLAVACPLAYAKAVHSYVDENGVLVYFNIPQKHTDIDGIPVALPEVVASPIGTALKAPALKSPYEDLISKHSKRHGVDPNLVRTVMVTESGFNPVAVSNKGACGLMQLIPSTARRFGVRHLFEPDENIEGGVRYLRFLLDAFKNDLKLALAAYNAGENVVKRVGGIPRYRETMGYVNRIVAHYGDTYRPVNDIASAAPAAAEATQRVITKVYRFVDAAGNISYTNRPTLE